MDKLSILLENVQDETIRILNYPDVRQSNGYRCGIDCVQTVLEYYGEDHKEEELVSFVANKESDMFINRMTADVHKIVQYFRDKGFQVDNKEMTIDELIRYIDRDIPVIVMLQAWGDIDDYTSEWNSGHYSVVIGYTKNKILFEDPSTFQITYLSFKELMKRWHDQCDNDKFINYGVAVYGKKPKFDKNKLIRMK